MKRLITIVLTLFLFNPTFSCLNGDSKVLKDGTFLYEDREGNVPYGHDFYVDNYDKLINKLDSLYNSTKDIDYLSDKGLLLILLKKYESAIKLYLNIEKIKPDRYSTASNIGTAYELIGENKKALRWIKKSVELDSESHNNSEWIHVKILEAKIKGEQFYTTNFLLNTDFGLDILPNTQMPYEQLQDLSNSLYYQLNERVSFVKPEDKIVAQLLFDIGNIAFLLRNNYDALADYKQAKIYGYEGELIEKRIEQTKLLIKEVERNRELKRLNDNKYSYLKCVLLICGGLILTILLIMIFKRNN